MPGKYVALDAARAGKGSGKLVEVSPGDTSGKTNWREESVTSLSFAAHKTEQLSLRRFSAARQLTASPPWGKLLEMFT